MNNLLKKIIIKSINLIDSRLYSIKTCHIYKNKINLNIYLLHSTRPKDFNHYKKILQYINKRSAFINPKDISNIKKIKNNNSNYSVLTFDDGFKDNYEFASTILKELNIKAIFFVIPKFISEKNKFSEDYFKKLYPNSNYKITNEIKNIFQHMNSKQINNLILEGHEIGIHGFEHEDYGKIKTIELEEKFNFSKNILKKLKIKTNHFAYPFGTKRNFTGKTNNYLSKKFKFIYTVVRGVNLFRSFKNKDSYIFKRNPLSTHKEDLVYYPIKLEEIYFFSFNRLVKLFYIITNLLISKLNKLKKLR